jgi:hypothetical protein
MDMTDHMTILMLALAIATVFAMVIAVAAGVLTRLTGATVADAVLHAGVAFAGALMLALAMIGVISAATAR